MGCHTWAYCKIKEVDTFRRIIEDSMRGMEQFINDEMNAVDWENEQEWLFKNFSEYMAEVDAGEREFNSDDVSYVDEETGQCIMYHEETFNQYMKRYNRYLNMLKTIYHNILVNHSYNECVSMFNDSWDIIDQCLSFQYNIKLHNGEVYVREFGDGYVQSNNPFNECPELFFRVYGYPCDEPDDFYESSPDGKNPHGWTDAESLIEFLEWYKNTEIGSEQKPYWCIDKKDDGSWNLGYGYTEELYDHIRKFFSRFRKGDVLIEFN